MSNRRIVAGLLGLLGLLAAFPVAAQEGGNPGSPIRFERDLSIETRRLIYTAPAFRWERSVWIAARLRREIYRAEVDLNDDGVPELIVIGEHPKLCHQILGCSMAIFRRENGGWVIDTEVVIRRNTMAILPETDLGWHRLYSHPGHVYERLSCGYYFHVEGLDKTNPEYSSPCNDD